MPALRAVWLGAVAYRDAWEMQRRLAAALRDGDLNDDCLLLLEHPPVFTMGRNGRPEHVPGGPQALRDRGAEYVEVDRGGSVTFHGPGQLVAYPVVRLAGVFPAGAPSRHGDVLRYVRALEAAASALAAGCGVQAGPRPPYTGAWVGRDKLAAIGVKLAAGGVTTHGLALNVTTDLSWFGCVVPCGISDGGVTSLMALGVHGETPESLAPRLAGHLATAFGRALAEPDAAMRAVVAGAQPSLQSV